MSVWQSYLMPSTVEQSRRFKDAGLTLVELLVVTVILAVIAALAIPGLLAYRRSANEGAAIATLRTIHNAEMTYQASNRESNFAGSLTVLSGANLIDSALASGPKNGYTFKGDKVDASSESLAMLLYSAVPVKAVGMDRTGSRRFGIATDGVLHYSETETSSYFGSVSEISAAPVVSKN